MAICSKQGIGVDNRLSIISKPLPDDLGEIFEINLMTDAGAGRNNAEVVESVLPPAQKRIALPVSLHFTLDIDLE